MTPWWRHQQLYGSLITDENGTFCTITWPFVIPSSSNLVWMMIWGQLKNIFNDVSMTSSRALRFTDYRRKWYILHKNSPISHPFTKLALNDDIGLMTNHLQWRHDDVISDYRRKWYILLNNSTISHPIFTKLGLNDDIGLRLKLGFSWCILAFLLTGRPMQNTAEGLRRPPTALVKNDEIGLRL